MRIWPPRPQTVPPQGTPAWGDAGPASNAEVMSVIALIVS